MNRTLYILAENFSNETRESFFEKELPYLSEVFAKIYVIPLYADATPLNTTAPNVEVLNFNFFQPCNRIRLLSGNFFAIAKIWLYEMAHTHHKGFYLRSSKSILNDLLYKFSAARNLEALIKKDIGPGTVFYSYWFMQWVAALSIIKMRNPALKIVSRVHGADYDEEQVRRPLPFRYFQLSKINRVFAVSAFAKKYLEQRFHADAGRIAVARLGLALDQQDPAADPARLHIVSCSSLIPLKRVTLIADILQHLGIPATWTHFGDGPLAHELKDRISRLPAGVSVELAGYVPNSDFIAYLGSHAISLFINVSESEGIPVTMMEAISFGIPLAGTAVCGVPEIVTAHTGILIDRDFDPQQVALRIREAHLSGRLYEPKFREGIRQFYKDHFFAPHNYRALAAQLSAI